MLVCCPTRRASKTASKPQGWFATASSTTHARGFDEGRFIGRNIWDRRYPVVDEERGVVLSIVRFGLKAGAKSQSTATANDRLVAEFFAIENGFIHEIQAVFLICPMPSPPVGPPRTVRAPPPLSSYVPTARAAFRPFSNATPSTLPRPVQAFHPPALAGYPVTPLQ